MALDEAMRHRIHGRFEELLGSEEAAAVMGAITQSDAIHDTLVRVATEVTELRAELHREISQLYRWTVGSIFAAMSLGLAASRILG
ncbi:MAG TPA: hypothetical protein VM262_05910 [Acidimicrobiales bacterium]|nr:hypothetical protein [Acidimicrobiales bacterium]